VQHGRNLLEFVFLILLVFGALDSPGQSLHNFVSEFGSGSALAGLCDPGRDEKRAAPTRRIEVPRESVHTKLERVRPPRVHVTYNVEIGDAIELKEIPFVMGVFADLSGMPSEPLPKIKDRRFVEITPDNFDGVLESMKPRVAFSVENKLSEDANAGNLAVDLNFKSMEDFEPENVARQVKPLRELLELRTKLSDLVGSLQGNEKLEQLLQQALGDEGKLAQLRQEIDAAEGAKE
jgi:type VI secretion system protein ImpB